jgi:hypothetical protein
LSIPFSYLLLIWFYHLLPSNKNKRLNKKFLKASLSIFILFYIVSFFFPLGPFGNQYVRGLRDGISKQVDVSHIQQWFKDYKKIETYKDIPQAQWPFYVKEIEPDSVDFYHPEAFPDYPQIELKWRNSMGSMWGLTVRPENQGVPEESNHEKYVLPLTNNSDVWFVEGK